MNQSISKTKKRNPFFAAVFSLVLPGLGHIYAGNLKKGLLLIFAPVLALLFASLVGALSTFYGIWSVIFFVAILYLYALISSVRLAIRSKDYRLHSYNRWYWYILIMITITIFANLITSIRGSVLGYETYRIPSTSMHPTLQVGDIITANTRYQTPQVGDVIVFLYPNDRKSPFVMRLAAKNGDVVSIKDGVVIRNGKAEHKLNVPEKNRQSPISLFMSERTIPQNEVFVLGDFRDNSNDSRFWGYVPYDDITGKVEYIWLSTNPDRIGMRVD